MSLPENKWQTSERGRASLEVERASRAQWGRRSTGKTYLTRERRSTAEMERRRTPEGESREKMALEAESLALVSIQAEDGGGQDLEGSGGRPKKSLQMRVGKAREKKCRDWSGECESRNDSMEAQIEDIWDGEEACMAAARSSDLEWESTVNEWGSIIRLGWGRP